MVLCIFCAYILLQVPRCNILLQSAQNSNSYATEREFKETKSWSQKFSRHGVTWISIGATVVFTKVVQWTAEKVRVWINIFFISHGVFESHACIDYSGKAFYVKLMLPPWYFPPLNNRRNQNKTKNSPQ